MVNSISNKVRYLCYHGDVAIVLFAFHEGAVGNAFARPAPRYIGQSLSFYITIYCIHFLVVKISFVSGVIIKKPERALKMPSLLAVIL